MMANDQVQLRESPIKRDAGGHMRDNPPKRYVMTRVPRQLQRLDVSRGTRM